MTVLNDGNYTWGCSYFAKGNGTDVSKVNRTFIVDTIKPSITIGTISTTSGSQTITFNSTVTDVNLDSCFYAVYNSTGSVDGANNNVSFTCNTNKQATVSAFATYSLFVYANDTATNINSTENSTFTTSPSAGSSGGGGGGGGATTVPKIPVIGLIDIHSSKTYSPLQREIFYAQINSYCSIKTRNSKLAVADYSDVCNLVQDDLTKIRTKIITLDPTINIPLTDIVKFYQYYKEGDNLFQGLETQDVINKYGLYTSILGRITLLEIVPPTIDKGVYITIENESYIIKYQIRSNKPLKECNFIGERENFNCLLQNSTLTFSYNLTSSNFFNKVVSANAYVTTDAESNMIEQRQIPIQFRIYNFRYLLAGFIPVYLAILGGGAVLIGGIFYVVKSRRVNIKKARELFQPIT